MEVAEMKERLLQLAETFAEQEAHLTELDRAIGDGDHGVNMLRGFKALSNQIDDSSMAQLFKSTGMTLMSQIGGASGPLYGFSFVKMSQVVDDDFSKEQLPNVLEAFAEAVAQRGKVERGEKTMFDVIDRAREAVANDERVTLEVLQGYAQDTVDLEATKGRAAYFKEESIGHMDPGAQSSVYILDALIGEV
ncbi:dihydroxyacetone kinase subunit DhaL [Staphylococcus pettenkoferi]|uniref:Dihydroxyacetone kinase subunit DhaL n=1 Tax=Staphylococcus pettenkoferi TaxID=170573 RepID=A0ABT4BNZ5_9STAP|nr:dihydroxyacetone kinase subunit DhaL [Staphylococcus pettenkoferi]MCI2803192.1 dihydroxyacetone kinase subunit L [Staphylococcus pettenkoferi]MCY1564524.1 dihydroxyacetone kinase subunit DhaL [Staphylococcus pettenkoferi]MCY1572266.1 dihydroxyacetone kinase subunit DhaL [Staphylococcus pettenkoferi]MCY1583480.1 dihydroxyacetone kinase subunit DhaL [Staphylococcus pettenkoferi]MCY1591786.1 dihydroxyacetone kinase subunit DhaL [Staphylococcus pettenkoferi]